MNGPHSLRCYDYVNQPYARVRDALRKDAAAIFRRATTTAVERTNAVGAQLHVHVGVLDVATDIALELGEPKEEQLEQIEPATDFPVSWHSATKAGLFPRMRGRLRVFALSSTETQLELQASYDPPLGPLGDVIDAVVGHRIAEASVHNFVVEVAHRLRSELADAASERTPA